MKGRDDVDACLWCGTEVSLETGQMCDDCDLKRSACFGCVAVDQYKEQLSELNKVIRESNATCDAVDIAYAIANCYAEIRRGTTEHLLPEWPAAMVLDHIRNHHVDPERQTWSRLMEIQELIQIALKSSVETNDDGKNAERINKKK